MKGRGIIRSTGVVAGTMVDVSVHQVECKRCGEKKGNSSTGVVAGTMVDLSVHQVE